MLTGEARPRSTSPHLDHMRNPVAEANEVWVRVDAIAVGTRDAGPVREVTGRRLEALDAMTQATSTPRRGRRPAATRPTGGSCGSGTTTASCTNRTSG